MLKKLATLLLAMAMIIAVIPAGKVQAAAKESIPTKLRIIYYANYYSSGRINISLADAEETIPENSLKSDSKNILLKICSRNYSYTEAGDNNLTPKKNEYGIEVAAKKAGTYTVSFDVVKGAKKTTHKVTVYAYKSPVKSVTFNGKTNQHFLGDLKSGKVRVTLESGNKLKSLEYSSSKTTTSSYGDSKNVNTTESYTKFKNGGTIKVNHVSDYWSYVNNYSSGSDVTEYEERMNDSLFANTIIHISYVDKYTKKTETQTVYFTSYAK